MADLLVDSSARERQQAAIQWLNRVDDPASAREIMVVAHSPHAASELIRAARGDMAATFGFHRFTFGQLVGRLGLPALARTGLAPAGGLSLQALCARVVDRLFHDDVANAGEALGRYAPLHDRPGLARALAATFRELGLAGLRAEELASQPDLARIYAAYRDELANNQLADRGDLFSAATVRAAEPHPLLGLPTLFYDVPLRSERERAFAAAVIERAPEVLVVSPKGDPRSAAFFRAAMDPVRERGASQVAGDPSALSRLKQALFSDIDARGELDGQVELLSAPGESRECAELARKILASAKSGVPFDRMAILLRAPAHYRAHITETLHRAEIPAYFTRGTVRPDPAGRALLALLSCAAENLSARAFSEYLSLGVVPKESDDGAPPPPDPDAWVAPDHDVTPYPDALDLLDPDGDDEEDEEDEELATIPPPVVSGTLRAPRRWEKILVDASVIGGKTRADARSRWDRRLDGLEEGLELSRRALDADDPKHDRLGQTLTNLGALRAFATPLLDALHDLPETASWREWIERLTGIATMAIRDPDRVLAVLGELAPMGPIRDVSLSEVQLVLKTRLSELLHRASENPAGKVFVGAIEEARGLTFHTVLVPGLAEKIFPAKVREDPILLDHAREEIANALVERDDAKSAVIRGALVKSEDRVQDERLMLHLVVGAAEQKLILSWPRIEVEKGRPRVPSFYALEVLRAAEGALPGFDELARRAHRGAASRLGWPAPEDPREAIDEAEYDLAVLQRFLVGGKREDREGAARYLLSANPHLARSLRQRGRRWLRFWKQDDGLVIPQSDHSAFADRVRAALEEHRLATRAYSATALQTYSSCPYRFYLRAIARIQPVERPAAIEELNPLHRGSLIHEVQFRVLTQLKERGALPLIENNGVEDACRLLDATVAEVAHEFAERLAPAIDNVWQNGVEAIRVDLRQWIYRMRDERWEPAHFELAFGLSRHLGALDAAHRDPASSDEPVDLTIGLKLRGSIDLVERFDGAYRATDYKTGKASYYPQDLVVNGGATLQPVLYALALEELLPDRETTMGRLYFCTARGQYEQRNVPLDELARRSAEQTVKTIDSAIARGFLPAAPSKDGCRFCDYQAICGPYEELRTGRKNKKEVDGLHKLRVLT